MRKTVHLTILGVCLLTLAMPAVASTASVEATNLLKAKSVDECTVPCDPTKGCDVQLFAGQFMLVGDVSVTSDGTNLHVVYDVTDPGWSITEVHFYAGEEPPTKAAPGQFPYKYEYLNTQTFAFDIPLDEVTFDAEGCLYFAAHAVVNEVLPPDYDAFAAMLPDQVTMIVSHPGTGFGDPSYFDVTISGGTVLDGTYDDWCVDIGNTISPGSTYTADVYSSYEDLPDGLVDHPENLDLVNWIINQGFVGQPSATCSGNYTYGDVQRAIWMLIDDDTSTAGLGSWTPCRAGEIYTAALASGEGFLPRCSDVIAVILVPVGDTQITIAQVTFAEIELECDLILLDGNETAWGAGDCAFKQGWGSYFRCSP